MDSEHHFCILAFILHWRPKVLESCPLCEICRHHSRDGEVSFLIFQNPAFLQAATQVTKNKSDIHLIGLLSDKSSPHADNDHILSLLSFFVNKTDRNIYLHLFTDGRDSPQFAAARILEKYKIIFDRKRIKIATIMGRFYAMDRKKTWDRTETAYKAMVLGQGIEVESASEAVNQAYNRGESDEFIQPTVIVKNKKPIATIKDKDAVIFFNLRSDYLARHNTR